MVRTLRALALAALAFVVAAPSSAAVYTIHLKNGTTFETRYQPIEAPWDSGKIVFTNEWGNLMSLAKSEIDRTTTDVEASGYGHMLDTTTMALGWSPNDAPLPGSEAAAQRAEAQAGEAEAVAEAAAEPIYDVNESPATLPIYPVFSGSPAETSVILVPPPGTGEAVVEPPQ